MRPAWQLDAACRDYDVETFYPKDARGQALAAHICRSCPVIAECLEYALATREVHGTWGGASEHERVKIRRRRGVPT